MQQNQNSSFGNSVEHQTTVLARSSQWGSYFQNSFITRNSYIVTVNMRKAKNQVAVWHYGPVSGTQGLEKQIPASGRDAASWYGWKTRKLTPQRRNKLQNLTFEVKEEASASDSAWVECVFAKRVRAGCGYLAWVSNKATGCFARVSRGCCSDHAI